MPLDPFTGKEIFVNNKGVDTPNETSIPVTIPGNDKNQEFFDGLINSGTSLPQSSPTTWDAFKHDVAKDSEWVMPFTAVKDNMALENPLDDRVDPNWKVTDDARNFAGLNPKYFPRMSEAKGPKDAKRLNIFLMEKQQEEEFYSKQGWLPSLSAMAVTGVTNPSSLLGALVAAKYAVQSENTIQAIQAVAPSMAVSSILHEGEKEATTTGGNLEDFVVNTLSDTLTSTLLLGGGIGLNKKFDGVKLWQAGREATKYNMQGIMFEPVIDSTGEIISIHASAIDGMNVGAAKVDEAQNFSNSKMAQEGLFAIPIIGKVLGKGIGKISPYIRGITSKNDTVAGFFQRAGNYGIRTVGTQKGIASPDNFTSIFGHIEYDSKEFSVQLKGMLAERNNINLGKDKSGLSPEDMDFLNSKKAAKNDKFNLEIANVLRGTVPSDHGVVNEAADRARFLMDSIYKEYRALNNLPEEIVPPPTSPGHFPRTYNSPEIQNNMSKWREMNVEWSKEGDAIIDQHMKPIVSMKEQIDYSSKQHESLIRSDNVTTEQIKKSSDELFLMKNKYKALKEQLQDKLRASVLSDSVEDRKLKLLIDDRSMLSSSESKKLKSVLKKHNQLGKEVDKQKAILDKTNQELFFEEQQALIKKTKEGASKHVEAITELKKQKTILEAEHKKYKDALDTEKLKLQDDAASGRIPRILYDPIPNSMQVKFKNPSKRLKFRNKFESEYHMEQAALAMRDKILNQTLEDSMHQMMNATSGGEREMPLMQRTNLIPEEYLVGNNFLLNDVAVTVANYRNMLGRRIAFKKAYSDVTINGSFEEIVERFHNQFKANESVIHERLDIARESGKEKEVKKLEKELSALTKEFNNEKSDMQLAYNKMMGKTNGSKKQREYTAILRNLTSAIRLGSVPLTMTSDTAAIIYKNALWPSIRDGLMPFLKSVMSSEDREFYRQNAGHAAIGLNQYMSAFQDRNTAGFAQPFEPISSILESKTSQLAHLTNNLAGTNQYENFLQILDAGISQSTAIERMLAHEKGTLSKANRDRLLTYGLDPEKWSARFLKGWRQNGSDTNGFGGYNAWYWKWDDVEAANKMSDYLYRHAKDTIIRREMLDAPFFMDDPWASVVFMFKGWGMAAMNRYTVPLMQQPDAQHIIGAVFMLGAGSMITPLRRISRGEDPFQDDDSMAMNAIIDSNLIFPATDMIQTINLITDDRFMKSVTNDRYHNRSIAGAIAGPTVGAVDDIGKLIGMLGTHNYNSTDIKRGANLVPGLNLWYTKGLVGLGIDKLGLPKNFSQAQRENQ